MDSASMWRRLRDSSVTGEHPLPSTKGRPLHKRRRRSLNHGSRSFYPKRWRSLSASRATAPHTRQSSQELRGLAIDKDFSFCRYCNKGLSSGRFLRSGKRRADQPICASSIKMRLNGRIWRNPSEVQGLVYLLLDEFCDGKFKDGKPNNDNNLWQRITANLSISDISVTQVVNKVASLKLDYRFFCALKKQTGIGWNYETNTVDADEAWWDRYCPPNSRERKFKKKGLDNFDELDLLFSENTASGISAYSSGQGGETVEEVARVESQNRYRHGLIDHVTEEHIASGGVQTDSNDPTPMNTQSGSRKRRPTSISGRGKEKVQHSSEEVFLDKASEYLALKCQGGSHPSNQTLQLCI